jgi:hypothetical protein
MRLPTIIGTMTTGRAMPDGRRDLIKYTLNRERVDVAVFSYFRKRSSHASATTVS